MIRVRTAPYLWTALLLSSIVFGGVGCSKKQLSSSSEDQSTSTKSPSPVETIQADRIASIEPPAPPSANAPATGGESRIQEARTQEARTPNQSSSVTPANSVPPVAAQASSEQESVTSPDTAGIGDIYFDFDQYTIRADALPVLERNGQWIRNNQSNSLLIEGHCDERGTLAYNLVLGEKRATAAKRYLENLGIPGSRLHTTSYGEVRPVCTEHNEGCWKHNRRAHFVVQ